VFGLRDGEPDEEEEEMDEDDEDELDEELANEDAPGCCC
jgi:hypothetical protein